MTEAPQGVDIFIPAHNEEEGLAKNLETLLKFARPHVDSPFRIVVVENGSADRTLDVARAAASSAEEISVLTYPIPGRGRALRSAFLASTADICGYMDADLSTHLKALVEALHRLRDGADVVIGSRLSRGARTKRRWGREILSRSYNTIVRATLHSKVRDHQCGFKFLRLAVLRDLIRETQDDSWFFDTELLVLAQRAGLRIDEIPVDWIEDLGSTVRIMRTIRDDLAGIASLRRRLRGESSARK